MFDELSIYKNNDHFFLTPKYELEYVCNAPKDKSGVYIVYQLKNGKVEFVYIGSSGKVINDGSIKHQTGGLYDSIVNGHQFGAIPRKKSWKQKLIHEKIEALDIYWYETTHEGKLDIPLFVKATILQRYYEINGCLPSWNEEF